ncbi:MAG: hypothetical protein VKL39_16080, partial [Leptolyngbyaceae bacterium]|nr:hypothetical protein [Leptolyngbyaceae bacterium]
MAQQTPNSFNPQRSHPSSPDGVGGSRSSSVPGWQTVEFPSAVSADASERQSRYAQFMTRKPGKSSSSASKQSSQSAPQSAEGLIALIQDTNQRNHELMDRVAQLEEALEQSRQALQQELDRVDGADDREPQASESDVDAAQQVSYLLNQLEFAQQANQRQEILVETLTRQLEASQARVSQLEKECEEFHQTLAQQSVKIQESDRQCRDLQARLQRQQQYTLQFKVALDKCLEVPPPSYETAAPPSGEATGVEYPKVSSNVAIPQIPLAEGAIPPVNQAAPDLTPSTEESASSVDVPLDRFSENTVLADSLIPKTNHIKPWSVDDLATHTASDSFPPQASHQEEPANEPQATSTPPDLFAARFQDTLRDLARTDLPRSPEFPFHESQSAEAVSPSEPQVEETPSSVQYDVPATDPQADEHASGQVREQASGQVNEQERSPTPIPEPDPQRLQMPEPDLLKTPFSTTPLSLTEKLSDLLGTERDNQPDTPEAESSTTETDSPTTEKEPAWVKWRSFLPPDLRQMGDRPSPTETPTDEEANARNASGLQDVRLPGESRPTRSDSLGASVNAAFSNAEPASTETESQPMPPSPPFMDDEADTEEQPYGTKEIAKLVNATAEEILRIQQAKERNEFSAEPPGPVSLSEIFSRTLEPESDDDEGSSSSDEFPTYRPTYRQGSIQSTEPSPDPWTTTPGSYLNPSSGSEKVTSIPPFSVARNSDDDHPLWAIARPSQAKSADSPTSEPSPSFRTDEAPRESPPVESDVSSARDGAPQDAEDTHEEPVAQERETPDASGMAVAPDGPHDTASSEASDRREPDTVASSDALAGADAFRTSDSAEVPTRPNPEKTLRDVSLYTPPSDGKAFQKRTSFSSLIFSVSPSAQSKSQG